MAVGKCLISGPVFVVALVIFGCIICPVECLQGNEHDDEPTFLDNPRHRFLESQEKESPRHESLSCPPLPKSYHAPQPLILEEDRVLFLHPGKSGGGSLESRLGHFWNIHIPQCHPDPCPDRSFANPQLVPSMIVMITIRDPIDRMVSAFNWRMILLCDPAGGDTREMNSNKATQDPSKYCKGGDSKEADNMLVQQYQKNVTLFAEALCTERGKKDAQTMHHMVPLVDWLDHDKWKTAVDHILPVILEEGFDFNQQVDEAVLWMQENYHIVENQGDFDNRTFVVKARDCQLSSLANQSNQKQKTLSAKHSSSSGNATMVSALSSPQAEYCAAQYYAKDYMLLQYLIDNKACKSDLCAQALKAILERRGDLLSNLQ